MSKYAKHLSTKATPQSEPVPGKPMVPNSAGGYAFAVDDWTRLHRFLVLGSERGTYYATERKLTLENAECVLRCIAADVERTVRTIVEISDAGRAPKNDPAVFALALVAAAGHVGRVAEALPKVARIGTHLFQFVSAVDSLRGWGRGLRRAVAAWYESKSADDLAYQAVKYQQRDGWSHRDVLRLCHPNTQDPGRQAVYRWAIGQHDVTGTRVVKRGESESHYQGVAVEHLPRILAAFDEAKRAEDGATTVRLIREANLPRECIPTDRLNSPAVWEALLERMPLTAMIRNLAKMTAVGLLKPMSSSTGTVCDRLGDEAYLRKSRVHPIAILIAARTYARGRGVKGSLSWTPVSQVNDALDAAFYQAFGNVEPAGKRTLIALDVSGSMMAEVAGTGLSCREGSAAMAMIATKTEPVHHVVAFTCAGGGYGGKWDGGQNGLTPLAIGSSTRLADAVAMVSNLPFGGTDCALPMLYATAKKLEVDTFLVITDNETWHGAIHPCQALQQYRQQSGIPAKLAVMAMTPTPFSIADPSDTGMLDVVGFDAAVPSLIADFSRGSL
jgi:60 kDa SS-A/Ro ribonucleoprotein